ncbi:MAG: hypothetical protein ACLQBQ_08950 [Smithella sp.]
MKRLGLFVVALVFAFCTTVMAADTMAPAAPGPEKKMEEKAAVKKAKKIKKIKKMKKEKKEMKKKEMKEMGEEPAAK